MRGMPDAGLWRSLLWWLGVTALAYALKFHYSNATSAELEWMLRPLSQLLQGLTGHAFRQDDAGEWVSIGADVRLVKACAGVNFMLMSFLVYAWVLRPARRSAAGVFAWSGTRVALLALALGAAWLTCLLANTLRIALAMAVDPGGLAAFGLDATAAHRLTGMLVYVPLLSLQMLLSRRASLGAALAAPVLVYFLLMVVVPLLTGNAWGNPPRFAEHLLWLTAMAGFMGLLALALRRRQARTA